MRFDVVVVGSINQDLTVFASRRPRPGETVLGGGHRWGAGGKGANQAVAAARLGSRTAFVGCVGGDEMGKSLRDTLEEQGVDVSCVRVDPSTPSGLAVIVVDDHAENSIVVSPGANMQLSSSHISECSSMFAEALVVLAQLEIPVESVLDAANATQGMFLLNPAPARAIPGNLLERVDVLIPNRSELADLASVELPRSRSETIDAARRIEGPGSVVVTLGGEGAMVVSAEDVIDLGPVEVEPVDTTGAGDAFSGAMASALARGDDLVSAAKWATRAGGLATTKHGAQAAMPTREEMERYR